MTNLLKTRVVVLVPTVLILAACAQQPAPEAHAAPMDGGTMGMQGGAGNQMSGMGGMMHGGASGQMADMDKMMMQMSQMMDRCNAMMQHETMQSPGPGTGSHQP